MRIIIFVPFRAEGGSLKNLAQLLGAWDRQGHIAQHTIILYAAPESIERILALTGPIAGLQTEAINGAASQGIGRLFHDRFIAHNRIKKLNPNAIFCPGGTLPNGVIAPTIINYQNLLPLDTELYAATQNLRLFTSQYILRRMFKRSLAAATVPIFNSQHALGLFERLMGGPLHHARVIPRAMEIPGPDQQGAAELIREVSPDTPFVLSIGHIYPYKKYDMLIRGFAEYTLRSGAKLNYLIAGGVASPQLQAALAGLAERLGVARRVHFLGAQPYRLSLGLMVRARVFMFGSTVENCPNALLEAMAMAKPIICSNRSSMPEFAGDTVCYVNPDRPAEIADALKVLMNDSATAERLGKAAFRRVHEMPGVDDMAAATMQAIVDAAMMQPFPRP